MEAAFREPANLQSSKSISLAILYGGGGIPIHHVVSTQPLRHPFDRIWHRAMVPPPNGRTKLNLRHVPHNPNRSEDPHRHRQCRHQPLSPLRRPFPPPRPPVKFRSVESDVSEVGLWSPEQRRRGMDLKIRLQQRWRGIPRGSR